MQFQAGTMQQLLKTMQLKREWTQKQKEIEKSPLIELIQQAQKERKMSSIKSLLMTGKRLNSEEKAYLLKYDPTLYQKVKMVEEEQEAFKRAMKKARTKDEVDRLNFTKTQQFTVEMSHIIKSPMPAGAKQAAVEFIEFRAAAIREAFNQFILEGKYSKLPSEAELEKKRLSKKKVLKKERAKREQAKIEQAKRERIRNESAKRERVIKERKAEQKKQEMKLLNGTAPPSPEIDYDAPIKADNYFAYTRFAEKDLKFEFKKGKKISEMA